MKPAPLIPRSVLFGNPHRTSPEISPDGRLLGYVAPLNGVLNVWVGPLDGSAPAEPVTHDKNRGVAAFGFCQDDRTLIYIQDEDGDENWRVYLHDLVNGDTQCATPFENVRAQILRHNRWHPETVLIGLNNDNPQLHDVYRLDLPTVELHLVQRNPGFASWLIDSDLTVRGATAMNSDGSATIHLRDPASTEFTPWRSISADDLAGTDIIGFTRDHKSLLMLSPADSNTTRLLSVDVISGAERVVAADPRADVGAIVQDPDTLEPQAAVFAKTRDEWVWLDPTLEADVAAARDAIRAVAGADGADGEIAIGRSERTDRIWLIPVTPSDGPTRYYVHDRETRQARLLFAHKPDLDDQPLAAMESFDFTARDGLEISGYVTFPPGIDRRSLPAVLAVHGGPRARDSWGFRPDAQWLANRGYVCLQVNFRGSLGYGKAFSRAGYKEWGRKMQHDLLDAVDHVAELGWVDRSRIGIMGTSYGGYAALAGAAFTPHAFRCAIDVCGPSSLLTLLESIPAYWQPMISYMHATVGDPGTEREMLWERSPLSRVDDIEIPILIAQGKNDPRVKQAESEQIVQALTAKGLPCEYLLFEDEGHGLAKPENRETFYAAAEKFLAEHLGGRIQPDGFLSE